MPSLKPSTILLLTATASHVVVGLPMNLGEFDPARSLRRALDITDNPVAALTKEEHLGRSLSPLRRPIEGQPPPLEEGKGKRFGWPEEVGMPKGWTHPVVKPSPLQLPARQDSLLTSPRGPGGLPPRSPAHASSSSSSSAALGGKGHLPKPAAQGLPFNPLAAVAARRFKAALTLKDNPKLAADPVSKPLAVLSHLTASERAQADEALAARIRSGSEASTSRPLNPVGPETDEPEVPRFLTIHNMSKFRLATINKKKKRKELDLDRAKKLGQSRLANESGPMRDEAP